MIKAGWRGRVATVAVCHVVAPVGIGAFIYLGWRDSSLPVFAWAQYVGAGAAVSSLRSGVWQLGGLLPPWFLFSLPDGLWVYALTVAMLLLWRTERRCLASVLWPLVGVVVALVAEVGQVSGLVPGTFDAMDVVFCLAASVAAYHIAGGREAHVLEQNN